MDVNNGKNYHFALIHRPDTILKGLAGKGMPHYVTQLVPLQRDNGDFGNYFMNDSMTLYFFWDTTTRAICVATPKNWGEGNARWELDKRYSFSHNHPLKGAILILPKHNYPVELDTLKLPVKTASGSFFGGTFPILSRYHDGISHNSHVIICNQDWVESKYEKKNDRLIGRYYRVAGVVKGLPGNRYTIEYVHNIGLIPLNVNDREGYDIASINIRLLKINGVSIDKIMGRTDKETRKLPKNYAFFK